MTHLEMRLNEILATKQDLFDDINVAQIEGQAVIVTSMGDMFSYAELIELADKARQLIRIVDYTKVNYDVHEFDSFGKQLQLERLRLMALEDGKKAQRYKKDKQEATRVYLMINAQTGHHKIGYSKRPAFREATLQSQEPSITLLAHYAGTKADERVLHQQFAGKRVRGEWFDLLPEDVVAFHHYFAHKA